MIKLIINERIKESGLKKSYIAMQMNVSKDTLTNWVNGRSMIKLDHAVELAELLGCKVDDLYKREAKGYPEPKPGG